MPDVYANLDETTLRSLQENAENTVIIIKFTADWCGPCKRTKSLVEAHFCKFPENTLIFELDVDDPINKPLYAFLKTKRLINGIPAFLAYYTNVERAFWYVPDDSVNTGNPNAISHFFNIVLDKAKRLNS
tara:strand:- start:1346 stop:1735 length:390 start_codon:yes stop_codon:yes gene_type:complete